MRDAELVGGVLFDVDDPLAAGRVLFELLSSAEANSDLARSSGLEPALVESLKRKLPSDRRSLEIACAEGVGWVLGRRSCKAEELWEVVASLPAGTGLPNGLRRTTGETMIGMVTAARNRIRLAAPYIDESGIGFLTDSITAATKRGVTVEVFNPKSWEPARAALAKLTEAVKEHGEPTRFKLFRAVEDAPFAHLKVIVVDGIIAYIGSANITAAGLAGRNLELGVLVQGGQVATIESLLDLYTKRTDQ